MELCLFEGGGLGDFFEGVRWHNLRGFVVQVPQGEFFFPGKILGWFDVQGSTKMSRIAVK